MLKTPRRAPLAAAVLAALAAFAPVPAGAEGPIELGAVTTVEGSGPSSTLVTVSSPARISAGVVDNKDISVEGTGRYIGVALVAEGFGERNGPLLLAGQIDDRAICDSTGCPYGVATLVSAAGLQWDGETNKITVPPGLYRLHLISEPSAGPVSVSLRFAGLSGEVDIQPSEESGTKTVPLPAKPSLPQSQSLYWNSATHDMGANNRGIMWSMVWMRQPLEPQSELEYCIYRGREAEDGPGCPDPDKQFLLHHALVGYPVKEWVLIEGFGYPVQGSFAQKVWFQANLADGVDGLAVWLPFGDVPSNLPDFNLSARFTFFPVVAIAGGEQVTQPVTKVRCDPEPCDSRLALAGA